jgi:calmodulin
VKEEAFLKFMEKKRKEEPRESLEDLLECFRTFDKDGNGMITLLELKHIYTTLNPSDEKFSDAEWAEVEKELDDGSGMVGYVEFAKLILG